MDVERGSSVVDILRPILTPLSSLSDLAAVPTSSTKSQPEPSDQTPQLPRKRPRSSSLSVPTSLDGFLAKATALREQGGVPDTLFFPECPQNITDVELMEVVRVPVRATKRVSKKSGDKVLLWIAFHDEDDCIEAWKRIEEWRKGHDGFKMPVVHRGARIENEGGRKKGGDTGTTRGKNLVKSFRKKMNKVLKDGGLGNTLLFRGIPMEVSVEEFEEVTNDGADDEDKCIKLRTAEGKGGAVGRNMWVVFAKRETVEKRFVKLSGKPVSFRCGKCVALKPVLHNDAGDADTKKRRLRECEALQRTPSKTRSKGSGANGVSHKESLKKLEDFLQKKPELCLFMNSDKPQDPNVLQSVRGLW